jgi:hypothetical protein
MGGISFYTQFQLSERQSIAHLFRFSVSVMILVNHAVRGGRNVQARQALRMSKKHEAL